MSDLSASDVGLQVQTDPAAHAGSASAQLDTRAYVPKERVATIYDGIVAIAATLLVLDIGVTASGDILTMSDVAAAARVITHWLISFMMIAVLWTEFHFIFAHSKRWDGGLLALTFAQAAAMSLIPFAAGLVGDYPDSFAAALVFAGVMMANGLLVTLNALALRGKVHLHEAQASYRVLSLRIKAQVGVYTVVAAISTLGAYLHHPLWGVVGWLLCPVALALVLGPAARRTEMGAET